MSNLFAASHAERWDRSRSRTRAVATASPEFVREPWAPEIASQAPTVQYAVIDGSRRLGCDRRAPCRAERTPALRVVEIDEVGGRGGIVSLAHQVGLRVFEGAGHFHLVADAQEQRTRVVREGGRSDASRNAGRSSSSFGDQRGHAGPAVGAGNGHAVNIGVPDSGKRTDRL